MTLSLIAAFVLLIPAWLGAQTSGVVPWTPLDSGVTAFVGINVVPMDRDIVLVDHTVLVRNGRIAHLGPRTSTVVPGSARRIDGRNK